MIFIFITHKSETHKYWTFSNQGSKKIWPYDIILGSSQDKIEQQEDDKKIFASSSRFISFQSVHSQGTKHAKLTENSGSDCSKNMYTMWIYGLHEASMQIERTSLRARSYAVYADTKCVIYACLKAQEPYLCNKTVCVQ